MWGYMSDAKTDLAPVLKKLTVSGGNEYGFAQNSWNTRKTTPKPWAQGYVFQDLYKDSDKNQWSRTQEN